MISAVLIGDREVIARFTAMPGAMLQRIVRTVTRLGLDLERLVKQKLSGEVLNVRSGVLRSSINTRVTQSSTEVTSNTGTNVKYARFHEEGVPHSWEIRPVKARALAFQLNGQSIFAMRVTHPPLPERSFLGSALREMTPKIRTELEIAVGEVIHNDRAE